MTPVIITVVLAVGIGLLTGGRLSGLSAMRFRLVPAALSGLLLQFLIPSGIWQQVLLFASFLLLTAFAVANIKIPGFTLILAGIVMNFLVIGVNAGMPVPRWSLERSDQIQELQFLIEHGGAKHHLATEEDTLMFLADVIPLPSPIRQSVSAGDVVTYAGVAYVIVAGMRRRRVIETPEPEGNVRAEAPQQG
jgi:Family of unknown function (DUF5317)